MSIKVGSVSELSVSSSDVSDFYKKHWARPICLSDKSFYRWQFIDNPENNGNDDCCIAMDGDEIIGVMGLNSRAFYAGDKKLNGAELTTWVVAKEHRNRGCGPAMIEYLKNNYDVMIGMGISLDALPVYLRSGFRYIKSIPRYVHVINWDNVKDHVECAPLAKKYANGQLSFSHFESTEFTKEKVNEIYESFRSSHFSFSRGYDDIKWRYEDNPYFEYQTFVVNDACLVSVRIDRNIDGFVMAHCVDIFGDHKHYKSAISAAVDYAQKSGADALDFFSVNSKLNAELNAMGIFSTLDHEFFKFPHLFHPVEIRTPATTSLILWCRGDMAGLLDTSKLHITKQDADFDRPTIHGMKK